jgi:hypothetical protein
LKLWLDRPPDQPCPRPPRSRPAQFAQKIGLAAHQKAGRLHDRQNPAGHARRSCSASRWRSPSHWAAASPGYMALASQLSGSPLLRDLALMFG